MSATVPTLPPAAAAAPPPAPAAAALVPVAPPPERARKLRPGSLSELWHFRQLVGLLVVRELKVRYKRSILGLLWTMLNPLILMVVYTVVFTTIMQSAVPDFSIFLLSGLLPWMFLSTALLQGLNSVLGNQELIKKVRVPQAVFPLSVVGSNLVNFGLSLLPLFLVMLVLGHPLRPALFFLPVSALVLTAFAAGVTLFFASATVFFRDVRHLTEVLLQILFYLSPVFYDAQQIDRVGSRVWWIPLFLTELRLNPMTYLLPLVRDPVYRGQLPPLETVAWALAWAGGSLFAGYLVFRRLEPRHIHHF